MKRALALFLSIIICLSLFPAGVFAEETVLPSEPESVQTLIEPAEETPAQEASEPSAEAERPTDTFSEDSDTAQEISEEPSTAAAEVPEESEASDAEMLSDEPEIEILVDVVAEITESAPAEKPFGISAPKTVLTVGESVPLKVVCTDESLDLSVIVWTSSDESILTVDGTGLVTAAAKGKAMITAAVSDGVYDTIKLTVADEGDIVFAGEGTADDPWQIGSEAELAQLAQLVNCGDELYACAGYVLTENIVFTAPWTPIGTPEHPFMGSFDGCGKILSSLTAGSSSGCFGLFGTANNAVITGIALENVRIITSGLDETGGIVGVMRGGKISKSWVTGTLNADGSTICGGLAGTADGVRIYNCFSAVEISTGGYAGGIAGYACYGASIERSYNIGCINSDGDFGFGSLTGGNDESVNIEYSYCIDTADKNGTVLTRKDAATSQVFSGFDFESVWVQSTSESYPYPVLRISPCRGDAKWAPDTNEYAMGYIENSDYTAPYSQNGVIKDRAQANAMGLNTYESTYTIPNLPVIRNQNPYGICWAHAIMAAAETSLIRKGYATPSIDLSELQLSWYHHAGTLNYEGSYEDPLNNFGGDRNYYYSTAYGYWGGDNYLQASKTVSSWIGPVNEDAVLAYSQTNAEKIAASGLDYSYAFFDDAAHLENVRMIPANSGIDVIKNSVVNNGALCISYASQDEFYMTKNKYYYCSSNYYNGTEIDTNHAVAIVGWDDTVKADNFYDSLHKTTPSRDGAWIVRNSWGDYWGNSGYFYMSYDSVFVADGAYSLYEFDFEPAGKYEKCYQYDGSAGVYGNKYISGTKPSAANIFTAKANDTIKAVSFWMEDESDFSYKIKVYKNLSSNSNPTAGTLAAEITAQTDYAGYYTLTLPSPISVGSGEKFSVVLESSADQGVYFSCDMSSTWSSTFYFTSCSSSGQSFYSSNGSTWTDMGKNNGGNLRIKAFADSDSSAEPAPAAPSVSLTAEAKTLTVSWNSVSGAAFYRVYRSTSEDGTYAQVFSGTATGFADATVKRNITYYYKVTAVSSSGKTSEYSNTVSGLLSSRIVVTSPYELESEHNYENNTDLSWYYTDPEAKAMKLTFDKNTEVENIFDHIYIYDGSDNLIGTYTYKELSGQTVLIPDNTVRIRLQSDEYVTFWGFRVTDYAAVSVYTVRYDANGGSGAPETQTKLEGEPLTLSSDKPTRIAHTFLGWATSHSADTAEYQPKEVYSDDKDLTLYAVWQSNAIVVTSPYELESGHNYANNWDKCWSYTDSSAEQMTLTFDEMTKTEANYDFIYIYDGSGNEIGKYSGDALAGDSVTVPGNTVIIRLTSDGSNVSWGFKVTDYTAIKTYTVSYDAGSGRGAPGTQTKKTGETLFISGNIPTLEGYTFVGWATESGSRTVAYHPNEEYTADADVTLFAVWKKPGDVNGDGKVSMADFLTHLRYCAGKIGVVFDPNALDINGDGEVNPKDYMTLKKYLAGEPIDIH